LEITEGKLKEILTGQRNDFQHIVGIFKEDLESKIQIIGEQFGSMMEDIQIIKSDVQFLKGALKKKVDYDEFDALVKRVSVLEARSRK